MKNCLIIATVTILLLSKAFGQGIVTQYKTGDTGLRKFLVEEFNKEAKNAKIKDCIVAVIFAKFRVDSTGNVRQINFSSKAESPQVFKNILQKIIFATNGNWIIKNIDGSKNLSDVFILPLLIEMEAGCNPKKMLNGQVFKEVAPNFLATDISYILDFDDNVGGNNNQIDCVLLKPLRIFSQN